MSSFNQDRAARNGSRAVRLRVAGAVCVSLALLGSVLGSIPASAQPTGDSVSCGDTITTDTILRHDLVNCPDVGIVIGADHVTLDLNGHSIDGDGAPVNSCPADHRCDVGVDNSGGHFGVTIRGGTVREFSLGVLVDGGTQNRIHHLAVSDHTEFGIIVQGSVRSAVEHNRMVHTGISGILLVDSTRSRVASNSVSGSQGFGIVLAGVKRSLVQSNRITGNDHGIAVQAGSSHNAVRLNLVSLSGGSAIDVGGDGAVANRVELNRLIDNGDGIVFGDSNDSVIEGNLVTGSGTGQPDAGGFGVRLDGSDRNIIRLNVVTGGRGPAITITSEEAPTPAESNVVSRNVANSTDADGITIDQNATQTLIVRNIANSNGDDGIDVKDGSAQLTRNTADDNHDLGIEAVPGVTDGGGNRANGNGNPAQCINIDCSNG